MFFLKELPTKAMLDKYTSDLTSNEKNSISEALSIMRQASLLVRNLETYFSAHDLSQLKFLILIVIDREPDRTSLYAHEIASRLDVSKPVLTRALKKLVDDGLLTSCSDPTDKRAKRIALTKKGGTCLSEILPGYFNEINKLMSQR
ncbi:MAG: MarR family transcriptional regulator [Vibrio sp.]|uniref:MarR family winged helix-turn-helix transcriptional regulator n=1 Tax=Vibrio TaxID=662 RepID=UPI001EC9E9B3|nr:MarR family transcriptional regulator [Vibrio sp.]NRB66147.1 MarR family transcriptional regulator [Vibrio sp.]